MIRAGSLGSVDFPTVASAPGRFAAIIALAVGCLVSQAAAPADGPAVLTEPLRLPIDSSGRVTQSVNWYGVYAGARKAGWLRSEVRSTGEDWDVLQTARFRFHSNGARAAFDVEECLTFDGQPPFALRAIYSRLRGNESSRETAARRGPGGMFQLVTRTDGVERSTVLGPLDFTLADVTTFPRWIASGRSTGDTTRIRRFRFDELAVSVESVTILGQEREGGAGALRYEVLWGSTADPRRSAWLVDAGGTVLLGRLRGPLEMRAEPEASALNLPELTDLTGRIRLGKPLRPSGSVTHLVLSVRGPGTRRIPSTARQSSTFDEASGEALLSVEADPASSDPATPGERTAALAETATCPWRLPAVAALASRALGDARTPREKVRSLTRFVREYLVDEPIPEPVSLPWVIASRRGDCTEHALLFSALSRASGIPTRQVSGLAYLGDGVSAFGCHAWCEVVVEGRWVAVDPMWDQVPADGTHIALDWEESPGFGAVEGLEFCVLEVRAAK